MFEVRPIGVLHTPWRSTGECPRNGRRADPPPLCTAELLLEFDELFHELPVEPFLLFRELALRALTLGGLPLLDARDLGVALLFEGGDHGVDANAQPRSLIRHPALDALGRLLDRALKLFARGRAEGVLRFGARDGLGLDRLRCLDLELHRLAVVVGRVEGAIA